MNDQWDCLVVGGSAAGLSAALDAGARRLRTLDGHSAAGRLRDAPTRGKVGVWPGAVRPLTTRI
jgi:thioredoxin reductase